MQCCRSRPLKLSKLALASGVPKFQEVSITIHLSAVRMVGSARPQIGVEASKEALPMAKTFISGIHHRQMGEMILSLLGSFRIGFKSPATISQPQETAQYDGTPGSLAARGRHDPCVVPRAVPIVEAMAAIVVMDQLLIQNSRKMAGSLLPPITTLPPTMVMPKK
jgi:Chorismate synthase